MADDGGILKGRMGRLGRLAGMATQIGADVAKGRLQRWMGGADKSNEAAARRVLETLGSLKGVALKVGQAASMFASGLPPEARVIVNKLFSQAPALPYEKIAEVIRTELGKPPEEVFATFSREPFAAASLGQVHAARLHTGEEVAVKIQYPDVAEALDSDLRNLQAVASAVGLVFDTRAYSEELRRELLAELDYRRERTQLEQFRGLLAAWPDLVVPRSYPEVSTGRVLVLERFHGPTLSEASQNLGAFSATERWTRGTQLVRAVFGPMVRSGIIHADVHPGNYVLLADGRFGVIDFGSIKHMSDRLWKFCRASLISELQPPAEKIDWIPFLRTGGVEIPEADEEKLRPLVDEVIDIIHQFLRGEYDFGADTTLEKLSKLKMRAPLELMKIRPPPESLLVGRALAGVVQNLKALRVRGDVRPLFREILELELT